MSKREDIRRRILAIAQRLQEQGTANAADFYRCTPAEIAEVEREARVALPIAYEEFLAEMGRGAGDFWVGTDVFFPWMLGHTQAAKRLVREDSSEIELPRDAVVFAMHQGYQFLFLRAGEGDDPPVYHYMEASGEVVKKSDRFTDFMLHVAGDKW